MSIDLSVTKAFRRPSAFLPIAMSLCAVGVIMAHLLIAGPAPQPDEGTAAHLWQLLMVAQVPFIAAFLIRWARQTPRAALTVLAAQLVAALAALAPVYLLKW
jgi:hypothetical protein